MNDGEAWFDAKSKTDLVGILHDLAERVAFLKEGLEKNTSHDNIAWLGISITTVVMLIVGYVLNYVRARVRRASVRCNEPPTQLCSCPELALDSLKNQL